MGCANIAQRLMIPAIKQLTEEFELVAVASRAMEKAEPFAREFGCEAIAGYDTLLSREDIDAVYMPLPTGLHKEWIVKALNAGKHVYAEKSIAMNGDEAIAMVDLAKAKDMALMEGYMFQYHPQHVVVKELMSKGEIGDIRLVRASFGFPPFKDKDNFRYDNAVGGGALKDAAGYVWRCANFLFGNIFDITASKVVYTEQGTSLYGTAFAVADSFCAEMSYGFDNYYQCNYEIWGSNGKIIVPRAFTPKPNDITHVILEKQDFRQDIEVGPNNHFMGAMREFHRLCCGEGDRNKHYDDIVYQAKGLDVMEALNS